jgi:Ran GTPase-activating protein (RanGAP) involved in mRNA processing and transport
LLIANCGLGGIGSKEILDKIHHCSSLELFSMGKNRVEIDGGLALADNLKHLPKLKALYVFQNGIRQHAMENLLSSISKHIENLEILDISDNFAKGDSIPKLIDVIKKFKLRALNLSDCIDQDDLKDIIEALKVIID